MQLVDTSPELLTPEMATNRAMSNEIRIGPVLVYIGDCLNVLPTLPPQSVHCIVTSPPYWGMRDYGAAWVGGDPNCSHDFGRFSRGGLSEKQKSNKWSAGDEAVVECKCGARRADNQIGLEPLHDCLGWARDGQVCGQCYVCHLRMVAKELHRVLRDDGTFWLNLADTYAGSGQDWGRREFKKRRADGRVRNCPPTASPKGLKKKDLSGIPWRVAMALQADGWYLRSSIIWAKGISGDAAKYWSGSVMPESVEDRPTRAHEYIFLLTKRRNYYFNPLREGENARNLRSVWTFSRSGQNSQHPASFPPRLVETCLELGCPPLVCAECGKGWREIGGAWSPSCSCRADSRPGVVLDPFAGSGTVGVVAARTGREAVLIEIFPHFLPVIRERLTGVQLPLLANTSHM